MINKKFRLLIMLAVIGLGGCFDVPDDFVMPVWDMNLSVPLTNYTYSLMDAIEDDSTLTFSDDPNDYGLIYYQSEDFLDSIGFDDEISIESSSTSFSDVLGNIKIDEVPPKIIPVRVEDWNPDVTSGSFQVFPENTSEINFPFPGVDEFREIHVSSGLLDINISNNLPVSIELRGFVVRNIMDGSIVVEQFSDDIIPLAAESDTTLTYDLSGKIISYSLEFFGVFHTDGSFGDSLQIPEEAGTDITASFRNPLVISRALAPVPEQEPIDISGDFPIADTSKIESAEISEGAFRLTITNHFALDMQTVLYFPEIQRANGNTYTVNRIIPANSTINIRQNDLGGWGIRMQTPGKTLTYSTSSTILGSNGSPVWISADDSVNITVEFEEIILSSLSGQIKPTYIEFAERKIHSGLDSVNDKFHYTSVKIGDEVELLLNLESNAGVDIEVTPRLVVSNGDPDQDKIINIDSKLIPANSETTINLRDIGINNILNSFSEKLPTKFILSGDIVVNPDFAPGMSISVTDFIRPSILFNIPFQFNITGGVVTDTVDIDIDNRDEIDKLKSVELGLNLENTIPGEIIFESIIYDANWNELLRIPPSHNDIDRVVIPGPSLNGETVTPGRAEQTVILTGDDADAFISSSKMVIHLEFETKSDTPGEAVKFRTTDYINVKMFGNIVYEVSDTNE